jgi:hypothetical protein
VKWFQVDSDTPNDPKIRAVFSTLGPAGVGALFLLWCHIADHGTKRPGWSINSHGRPIPEAELQAVAGLAGGDWTALVDVCCATGHFLRSPWHRRKVIAIPAMSSRADTYTKRCRAQNFEHSSKSVPLQDKTRQDKRKNPPTPLSAKGGRLTRRDLADAKAIRAWALGGCPHTPRCATYDACLRLIATARRRSNGRES